MNGMAVRDMALLLLFFLLTIAAIGITTASIHKRLDRMEATCVVVADPS